MIQRNGLRPNASKAGRRRCRLEAERGHSYAGSRVKDDDMQIRSKAYLQFISRRRSLRDLVPPHDDDGPAQTSPSLIYAAVVLALLLAILEIDRHHGELVSIGLGTDKYTIEPVFMGP